MGNMIVEGHGIFSLEIPGTRILTRCLRPKNYSLLESESVYLPITFAQGTCHTKVLPAGTMTSQRVRPLQMVYCGCVLASPHMVTADLVLVFFSSLCILKLCHALNGAIDVCSLDPESSRSLEHEMDSRGATRRRISENEIILSHSGKEKPFVEQLYHDLRSAHQHPFFDQDSDCLPQAEKFAPKILEAAEQCQLGVVVVSEGYLTSKWPMLELAKFVECGVPLYPLFFKLSPGDLKQSEVETKWKPEWRKLVERGEVGEEVMELWSEAVRKLRSINGLEYAKFANSEFRYRAAVVDEICKLLPPICKGSTDGIPGYGRCLEDS